MQLDRMTARIAPRTAWQAMDLGTRLYQHWFRPLTCLYLLVSLPALLLLLLIAGEEFSGYGLLLFWWLKPLWERPLLEYCARTLFSQPASLRELLRQFRQHTLGGILPWLLLRRLDPSRSFHLPVTQLEKQRGEPFRQRLRVLSMGPGDQSAALTFILLGVETILTMSLISLVAMMMPNQYYLQDLDWLFENESLFLWVSIACYYIATCLIAPLYVCCGFALYLNKRTWLEGWDLEVGLRHIGSRRERLLQRLTVGLLPLALLTFFAATSPPAAADQPDNPHQENAEVLDPKQSATQILSSEEFTGLEIKDSWRFKELFDEPDELSEEDADFIEALIEWLKKAFGLDEEQDPAGEDESLALPTLAEVVRFLLWVAVVVALLWLVIKIQALRPARRSGSKPMPNQTHVAGLDIRPESLPNDIVAHVHAALEGGDPRLALSLLYRASLSQLLYQSSVRLEAGATESECLKQLEMSGESGPAQLAFLKKLTAAWITTAWAHRPASRAQITELASLWSDLFEQPGETAHVA